MKAPQYKNVQELARDVVERARAGDQVAMGILVQVRENAKRHSPKAVMARAAIMQYIQRHPPDEMGDEAKDVMSTKAMHCIWKVPDKGFDEMFIKASPFVTAWQGVMCLVHRANLRKGAPLVMSTKVPGSRIGVMVMRACGIRRLRDRSVPLSTYCPQTGWEHGE